MDSCDLLKHFNNGMHDELAIGYWLLAFRQLLRIRLNILRRFFIFLSPILDRPILGRTTIGTPSGMGLFKPERRKVH
jgi:hypothetical protein